MFGRDRRVKADVPAGTFVVDIGPANPKAPRELHWLRGLVVEADSHAEAVVRANAIIDRINTVSRITSRLRR